MKILLKGVAALALAVVLAFAALLWWFDPNAFKPELISLARDKGQVALAIDGEIGWSLYPDLGLALPALRVDDLDGQRIAAVRRAEVAVALLPLLSSRLEVRGLTLEGLDLALGAPPAASGAAATQATPAAQPAAPSSPALASPAEPAAQPAASRPPFELDIARVTIRDAQLRYRLAAGQTLELSRFNLEGEQIVDGRAFPLSGDFTLRLLDAAGEQLRVAAKLGAEVTLALAEPRYRVDGLALQLELGGRALGGQRVPLQLAGDLLAEPAREHVALSGLQLELAGLQLRGELELNQYSGAPLIAGSLRAAPFDLKRLLQALGQPVPATSDPAALQRVGFEARLSGPANTLGLQPFSLQLDDSRFEGELGYDLVSGRQRLRLDGDQLDLDRYLPPTAESNPGGATAAVAAGTTGAGAQTAAAPAANPEPYSKEPLLPLESLRGLNFDAALGLDQLRAAGVSLSRLRLEASAQAGLIRLTTLRGELYGGRFDGSGRLDAREAIPVSELQQQLSGIQLADLLKDLAQLDNFSGRFAMSGNYRTRGNSIHALVNSLSGDSRLSLKDGRLSGINLVDSLCRGVRQLKGLPEAGATAPDYTEFSNLGATLKFTNGVATTGDLAAQLVAVGLGGAGRIDLPQQQLDLGLDLKVLQQLQGESCQIEEKLHNLALPVRCKGGFFDPPGKLCRPDTARMKQAVAKLTKREAEDKVKQKLEQKLDANKEKLKGVLKGLFK